MSFLSDGTYFLKNAAQDWSQTITADGTYRFEVRADDYYSSPDIPPEASDITLGKNRSEVVTLQKLQEGRAFVFDFEFMVESGAINTADWLLLAQFHQTADSNPDGTLIDVVGSPPLALQLRGERLEIVGRTDPNAATTTSPDNIEMYLGTDSIERDRFYNIRFEMVFDDAVGGNGMLKVYLDGVLIVDYVGPLGYNDAIGAYAQFGVYREQSPESFAAQFRNISLTSPDPAPPINGGSGDDMLDADKVGFLENEVLNGYGGNDTLSGGYGADTMNGGAGDDYYIVNDAGDVVNERSGGLDLGGHDLVQSYISFILGGDIEDLTLWAGGNIDGTGNARDNVIRGNTGRNTLRGMDGNDSMLADNGNDTVYGGNGLDTLLGGDGNDVLYGDADNDRLFGEAGDDQLYGGGGNDTLDSGTGNDTLYGGDGDDEYTINQSHDLIVEYALGGRDTVRASVSYDAGAAGQVEVLNTTNQGATSTINLSGTDLDNEIRGNNGRNILIGRGGNDQVFGFAGNDTLQGDAGADTLYGGSDDDSLTGGDGNDSLQGEDGHDTLQGGIGDDSLYGGTGNDVLSGGDGIDLILGGAGDDRLDGEAGNDSMFGEAGFDTLYGGDGNNALYGGADNDWLLGDAGNDTLEGGTGIDTMEGGIGNDQYVVDGAGSIVRELAAQGSDTVRASVSFDLGADNEIEFFSTTNQSGTAAIDLAGDDTANEMRGNNGANQLTGRNGDDRIFGYAGNDTIYGDAGNDSLVAGDGQDSVYGGIGNDTLNAEGGDDTLYGGDGDDSLIGGDGNSSLMGDAGNDILRAGNGHAILYGDDGDDIFYASAIDATVMYGGAGNDVLRGTTVASYMDGGAGNDTYYVDNSATQVVEATAGGIDTIRTSVSLVLAADSEIEVLRVTDQTTTGALNLTGSNSANELRGNNGNNRLDGGDGEDSLRGFLGDDTYIVNSAGDLVYEIDGQGNDTIITSISYTIGSTVFAENLMTSNDVGTEALSLTGNQIANSLRGNAGANRLSGGSGDDTLTGLGGNDTIYGGVGTDRVVLNVASTEANAAAGISSMILTTAEGADFISNDVEFFVFTDKTLTYAEVTALRHDFGLPPVIGTDKAENVNGTADSEVIKALGGNDWITPGAGSDTIDGGAGRDMLSFATLPDTPGRTNVVYRLDLDLTAGHATTSGPDVYEISNVERVTGTIYADRIKGSADADELRGLGDYDWFVATTGADTIDGGTGADMVSYVDWKNDAAGVSVDPLLTNGRPPSGDITTGVVVDLANPANNTHLAAGHVLISIERITGTGRADVFWGDGNENDFRGLGDYDWFVGSSGGRERYFGGDGVDTVTYFNSQSGVVASLSNGAKVGGQETGFGTAGDAARDLYFEIENLVGSNFADSLTGNSGRNTLMGLDGDDFLFGGAGIDMLKGGAGNDTLDGGAASDYAVFTGNMSDYVLTKTSATTITVTGHDGTDSLINVEYLRFDDGDTNIWAL